MLNRLEKLLLIKVAMREYWPPKDEPKKIPQSKATTLHNVNHLQELKELNLPKGHFVVFGSGPIALRGIRPNQDLDLLVSKELFKEMRKKYPQQAMGKEIRIGNISFYQDWPGVTNPEEVIRNAHVVGEIPFARLEHVIKWKKKGKIPKDKQDVELLKEYQKKEKDG
jgi:hypothetical protein